MNYFDYYLNDCILQGWRNVGWAFTAWSYWMRSDYSNYDCFLDYTQEDKEQSVRLDFWDALEDDILPKGLLEELREIVAGINDGTIKTYTFKELDDLFFGDEVE